MINKPERAPLYFWIGLAIIVLASAGWFFWPFGDSLAAPEGEAALKPPPLQPARVLTERPKVVSRLQRKSESSPAEVLAFEETDIHAKIPGFLEAVYVDIGDVVYPPDPQALDLARLVESKQLASFLNNLNNKIELDRLGKAKKLLAVLAEPEMIAATKQQAAELVRADKALEVTQAQSATAQALIEEAKAGLSKAKAQYKRWELEYDRLQKLGSTVIDAQTKLETWFQLQAARAGEEEAAAKIVSARAAHAESLKKEDKAQADRQAALANLNYSIAMFDYSRVAAPYPGVIRERYLHTGAFVNPGSRSQPIFKIARTDRLRVVVDIPEKDAPFLRKDKPNKVLIKFDALPDLPAKDRDFEWPITKFAPVLGAGKKVRAEIHVANPTGLLMPGMYGRATVILEEKPRAITISTACLNVDAGGPYVYKVVANKAVRQKVTLGLNDGQRFEIVAGLTEKDEIVSRGKDTLQDGQPVKP
jgi:RND family efflux transporter MFP subunit